MWPINYSRFWFPSLIHCYDGFKDIPNASILIYHLSFTWMYFFNNLYQYSNIILILIFLNQYFTCGSPRARSFLRLFIEPSLKTHIFPPTPETVLTHDIFSFMMTNILLRVSTPRQGGLTFPPLQRSWRGLDPRGPFPPKMWTTDQRGIRRVFSRFFSQNFYLFCDGKSKVTHPLGGGMGRIYCFFI